MKKNFGAQTWVYPMPVFIIATYDENGNPDAMNAAWGGIVDRGYIGLCLSASHKTTKNIIKNKAFTVSVADTKHRIEADYVGVESANQVPNKIEKSGFTMVKSEFVNAPVINELPMALECEYIKTTQEGLIIGKIINVCADEEVLSENGKIDPAKFSPITFDPVNNTYIALGNPVGNAFSDGTKLK
ncbi:MAG: flavin reductase family protein [Anaeroplasmataceae bacterium]|nr:flavin reductase family protein [Anaeroplasmataceae bacterium]